MKFKDKYNISKEFEYLFEFRNEEDEIQHEAKMLMFQILNEMERKLSENKKLKKKNLAELLGVTPSYISQLYSGDKLINLELIAKVQKALKIHFIVKAFDDNIKEYKENIESISETTYQIDPDLFLVKEPKPNYSQTFEDILTYKNREEIAA